MSDETQPEVTKLPWPFRAVQQHLEQGSVAGFMAAMLGLLMLACGIIGTLFGILITVSGLAIYGHIYAHERIDVLEHRIRLVEDQ